MIFARSNRAVVALLLYSCVLFSSFACALGHGQSSGLQLSGLEQGACGNPVAPGTLPDLLPSLGCALCSSSGAVPVHIQGWSLRLPPAPSVTTQNVALTPSGPAAPALRPSSPRAPPLLQV